MPAKRKSSQKNLPGIEPLIKEIRGQKIILDSDLAQLYGVSTKRLNEQVKRNQERFPEDFMFRLSMEEALDLISQFSISNHGQQECLRSQFATSKKGRGGRRYLPLAFTERGAVMAANVLNSSSAVQMSVFVVRAFIRMREMLSGSKELAEQLTALDKKLTGRIDVHETAIVDILERIMSIIDPPPQPTVPEPPKRRIGFDVD